MVESIGIPQLAVVPASVPSAPPVNSAPQAVTRNPAPATPVQQPVVTDRVVLSPQAVQQAEPKVEYANPEILGTTSFSLYKSATGEFVTRIVDQKTGKVIYIPKEVPVLGDGSSQVVNITA
jgi:hypothetical protein